MSLKAFYFAMLAVLVTVLALSLAWEFWLEDLVLSEFADHHGSESAAERLEFVATAVVFAGIAMIGPMVIGTRVIRRDQVLQRELIRLSQEDHLTGLLNRRRITEVLRIEIQRAQRYQTTFALVLMDIDHFKAINDRFGHQAGDRVLTKIAAVIRSRVRASDLVGRWGGEEFIIISPQIDVSGGAALAENIRTRLASAALTKLGPTTASFGVTSFRAGDDLESIVARADAGLYAAKQGGRNRVEIGPEDVD